MKVILSAIFAIGQSHLDNVKGKVDCCARLLRKIGADRYVSQGPFTRHFTGLQ